MAEPSVEVSRKSVKLRGIVGILVGIILVLLVGVGYLVTFSLASWGKPVDLGEKIETLLDQHDANLYVLAVCLSRTREEECKRVGELMARPKYLEKKFGR